MSRDDLVMRGDRVLVDGVLRPAVVVISDGVVGAVLEPNDPFDAIDEIVLRADEVLLPGLVDTHVHVNEPGRTEWEGFGSATLAAAAGGVTTLIDMPLNSIPPTVDVAALRSKREAATGKCHVDVGFWGGAVPDNLGDLGGLHDAGAFGVKCFLLDSGVPEFPPLDADGLERALGRLATFDGLMIVHAEDAHDIATAPAAHGGAYRDFLASRPAESERHAVEVVVDAARRTGARVHVVHVSSADAVGVLREARAEGVRVTAETCPHYLTLSADDVPDGATQFKCCPPIRDAEHRDRLWDGLVDGVIDIVVSDHSPSTPALKLLDGPHRGDFGLAWGGISSLQIGLPLVWTEARRRGCDLAQVSAWMSKQPARLVRLPHKGEIKVGFDADLVVFAPDERFTVDVQMLHHRHAISPYDGRELAGVVRATYLRGRRTPTVEPRGRFVEPQRSIARQGT